MPQPTATQIVYLGHKQSIWAGWNMPGTNVIVYPVVVAYPIGNQSYYGAAHPGGHVVVGDAMYRVTFAQ